MKLKIKVKEITEGCFPEIDDRGEWIDLRAAETIRMKAAKQTTFKREDENRGYKGNEMLPYYISLGVAIQLPKGFEAIIAPRSSCPKKFGFMIPNSIGVIDGKIN